MVKRTVQDVTHITTQQVNALDLSPLMTQKALQEAQACFRGIGIAKSFDALLELAKPQKSGNAKRVLWFYFVRKGQVEVEGNTTRLIDSEEQSIEKTRAEFAATLKQVINWLECGYTSEEERHIEIRKLQRVLHSLDRERGAES